MADAPTVIIAIHGVGNQVTGEIEESVKKSLTAGRVENVDVREFNWNAPGLHPFKADKLKARSAEDLARGFLRAASVGFANAQGGYVGFGNRGLAVHNLLAGTADFFVALTFALVLVLPLLTSLVLLPLYWSASYMAEQFRVIGWVLAGTSLTSLAALGLLLLLGAGYALTGAGRRRGYPAMAPLAVTARRALLIFLRPAVLIALPPFALPAREVTGKWVGLFTYGNLAALLVVYPIIWWAWDAVPLPDYALAINVALVSFVVTCWLAAWMTRSLIAPSLKIFLDIFRYVSEPEYRTWLQSLLDKAIEEERARDRRLFVILAHSLGSVIAADSLANSKAWRPTDRVLLITMGSPLRRFFFRFIPELFFPPLADAVGDVVAARLGDFRWANVYRPWDQVGGRLGLTRRGSAERSSGQWDRVLTAHPDYWADDTVCLQVRQAVEAIQGLQSPGWQPDADRLTDKLIMPRVEERDALAVTSYLLVAGLLVLATPLLFGIASGISKGRWDAILTQKKEELQRNGATADATVFHRVETEYTSEQVLRYDPATQQMETETVPKTRYIDQFEFRFTPEGGAEVTKKVDIYRDAWNEHQRFFDPKSLRDAVAANGEVLGKSSFWRSADSIGRRLKHVPLVYDADGLADPDAMWVLLPNHPPRPLTFKHVADWIGIVILSLLTVVVGAAIVLAGYLCFAYFLGRTQAFSLRPAWDGGD